MQISSPLYSRRRGRRPRRRPGSSPQGPSSPRPGLPQGDGPELPTNITTLVLRAAFMDGNVYETIRNHAGGTISAIGVVLVVGLLIATGQRNVELALLTDQNAVLWFVLRLDMVVIGWILWSLIAMLFGGWVFKGRASKTQVLRALGFATAPAVLLSFSEIDTQLVSQTVGQALLLFGLLWTLVVGTQAIKETMRLNWLQAIVPGFLGWVVAWILILNFVLAPASDAPVETEAPAENVTSTAQSI